MNTVKHLHIVSFDVPFPANYGGVIDVFYKIKYLNEAGVKVHLHCFEYGRKHSKELDEICQEVYYYKRKTGFASQFSCWPYIVKSRISEKLIQNLLKDDFPILFEGMHTLGVGLDSRLKKRFKIYRESNIEHEYYTHLKKAEKNIFKKIYFTIESWKLKQFEKHILAFNHTLVVSKSDFDYFNKKYSNSSIHYLPSFHPHNIITCKEGKGDYALYFGNLSVPENIKAVEFLISKVFSKIDYPFIIGGLNPHKSLYKLAKPYKNISIEANLEDSKLNQLIQNAQFNILVTFQATGLKLKLLNALHQGRFCLVNDEMIVGTDLDSLCEIVNAPKKMISEIEAYKTTIFSKLNIHSRSEKLNMLYNNTNNLNTLIELI